MSDNGTQFTSEEFEKFTKANGIKHMHHAVSSFKLTERFVQTFKRAGEHNIMNFQHQLSTSY